MFKRCLLCFTMFLLIAASIVSCGKSESVSSMKIGLTGMMAGNNLDPTSWMSYPAISNNVFDTLIYLTPDNKLAPSLAETWSVTDDGKKVQFKLRKGVKFSNGDNFTAKDVVFSFNRSLENNMPVKMQIGQDFEKIETPDDYTVDFYFKRPSVAFIWRTATIYLCIVSKDNFDKAGEKEYVKNPIGTGPYKLTAWETGKSVSFTANEYYWGKKPEIRDAQIIIAQDDNNRAAMLQTGEADMITDTPLQMIKDLEKAGYGKVALDVPQMLAIQFALINPDSPWAKIEVRQAINYAIDKKAIIEKLFGGYLKEIGWQFPWELGYDPKLKPSYPYNKDKAKELLTKAGYDKGFEMPLYYDATDMRGLATNMVNYLASSLVQIGIKVKPMNVFGPQMRDVVMKLHNDKKAHGVLLGSYGIPGNSDPALALQQYFDPRGMMGLYVNMKQEEFIGKACMTLDNKERAKIVRESFALINEDLPFIPVAANINVYMMKKGIKYEQTLGGPYAGPVYLKDLKSN